MQDDLNPVLIITNEGSGYAIGGGSSDIGNGGGFGCEKIPRV
jgi:hypothetical protein